MILKYDISKLKNLLQSFYSFSKIRIVIFDNNLEKIAEVPDYDCAFCSLIRKDLTAKKRCLASDRYACSKCQEENSLYSYTCHAGLTETVTPIRYGNIIIGYLMFGQVLQQNDPISYWDEVKRRCSSYNVDMNELYNAYCKKQPISQVQICAAAQLLEACAAYLWLQRYIFMEEDSLLLRIDEYISGHLDADLSVPILCQRFGVSRSMLYKITKEYYGCGVEQLICRLRIGKAEGLLKSTDLSVCEIANQVGYSDYNYFIKVFKKMTGITPAKYRKLTEQSTEENSAM